MCEACNEVPGLVNKGSCWSEAELHHVLCRFLGHDLMARPESSAGKLVRQIARRYREKWGMSGDEAERAAMEHVADKFDELMVVRLHSHRPWIPGMLVEEKELEDAPGKASDLCVELLEPPPGSFAEALTALHPFPPNQGRTPEAALKQYFNQIIRGPSLAARPETEDDAGKGGHSPILERFAAASGIDLCEAAKGLLESVEPVDWSAEENQKWARDGEGNPRGEFEQVNRWLLQGAFQRLPRCEVPARGLGGEEHLEQGWTRDRPAKPGPAGADRGREEGLPGRRKGEPGAGRGG